MFNSNGTKVLVIGLGQIGFSAAEYMTSHKLNVYGWDINEKAVQRALDNRIILEKATNFEGYDYYVICISTHKPNEPHLPFLDGLFEIAYRLSIEGKKDALVSIESTIPKGTSNEFNDIFDHKLHVAHFPHRFYVHEKEDHGVRQMRVLGGCEECCLNKASDFYANVLDIPVLTVESVEIAELSKIVENSYRFLEIAFAEELKIVCDIDGVNFDELRRAINSKWNVKILEARKGIGGHCLPKDAQMYLDLLEYSSESSLIDLAKEIDYQYRLHLKRKQIPSTFVATKMLSH